MKHLAIVAILFCITGIISPASGQEQKLTASDAAKGDFFGWAVAVSGDVVVVGAWGNDDIGSSSGSAYIYTNIDGIWTEQQKLTASDAADGDGFGYGVAISGDVALIGANFDNDNGSNSGSAYIFKNIGGIWTEQQKLTASDAAEEDRFGSNIDIFGDVAVIGATGNDDNGSDSGSAYIFRNMGGVWTEEKKLTASDAAGGDNFGTAVAIYGDAVLVGSFWDADAGTSSGSAYIFRHIGGVWTEEQKLTASDAAEDDRFGGAVAIYGDIAVVGSRSNDDAGPFSGSAYIFRNMGGVWTEEQKLTASDAAEADYFGRFVAIYGDVALVGSWGDADAGPQSGSTYIFRNIGGVWTEEQKLVASDAAEADRFGSAVAIYGDIAVVGARSNDDAGSASGSVYVINIPLVTSLEGHDLPTGFVLGDAFPNPFRLETIIPFEVPSSLHVKLVVYDMLGREVSKLVDGVIAQGKHTIQFDAHGFPSGTYVYRLETPVGSSSKTVHLIQ